MKTILALLLSSAFAYIPPVRMVLQRTAENSGNGVYVIEQEVQFPNNQDSLFLKETWVIESDHTMRLTVTSAKDAKDPIRMQFLYAGGQRWDLNNGSRESHRIPDEFLEKYFNYRSSERLGAAMIQMKALPPTALAKKPLPKTVEAITYEPEDFVRLARTDGVTAYSYGTPSTEGTSNPGFWIEQDQFVIRKIRLPTQVELTADSYTPYAKGLLYPKNQTVRWGQNTVNIHLIGVSARSAKNTGNTFQPSGLDVPMKLDGLNNQAAKEVVLEFYSRFR